MAGDLGRTTSWRLFPRMVIFPVPTVAYPTPIPEAQALPGPTTAWMGIDVALPIGIGVSGTGRHLARDPQPTESRRLQVTLFTAVALLHHNGSRPPASITVR